MSLLFLNLAVICCATVKEKPKGPFVPATPVLGTRKRKGAGMGDGISGS